MKKIFPVIFFFLMLGSACKKEELIFIKDYREIQTQDSLTAPEDSTDNKYRIIILMYHKLVAGEPDDIYERNEQDFENDLNFLIARGYQVLSFDDLLSIKANTNKLTANSVIISFDDGYSSDYNIAYPRLKEKEMPATFFTVTGWVGDSDRLTWLNVQEMDRYKSNSGKKLFSIESHTSSHPFLVKDSSNFTSQQAYQTWLDAEFSTSKNLIQSTTGQSTMWLALPYGNGANNPLLIATAKKYGYSGIRTSIYGSFTIKTMDEFALPSVPIYSTTDISEIDSYMP
jgi:peptidoglycan/xylan/chitin deacetylase (PgdA/CDA1 family)